MTDITLDYLQTVFLSENTHAVARQLHGSYPWGGRYEVRTASCGALIQAEPCLRTRTGQGDSHRTRYAIPGIKRESNAECAEAPMMIMSAECC